MMTSEQQLIFGLLAETEAKEIEQLLQQNIQWDKFIEIGKTHRILPLIQRQAEYFQYLPNDIQQKVQQTSKTTNAKSLNISINLLEIVKLLEKEQIPYLTYKGPVLSQLAYGDSSLRRSVDLDFLIEKKNIPKVRQILLENGGADSWNLTAKQEKAFFRLFNEFPMFYGKNKTYIELHWAFAQSFFAFDYDFSEVYQNRQNVLFHQKLIPTFSNEDQLIILTFHASKHYWKTLIWLCDVVGIVKNHQIDWEKTIEKATKLGSLRMLLLGLFLAEDLLKFALPSQIKTLIEAEKEVKVIAETLKKHLFDDNFSAETLNFKLYGQMRERWRDKFTFTHRLFTTKLVDSLLMPMGRPR